MNENNNFKIKKNGVLDNLFHVVKEGKPIFSFKPYGKIALIYPHGENFPVTRKFFIRTNEIEELVNQAYI